MIHDKYQNGHSQVQHREGGPTDKKKIIMEDILPTHGHKWNVRTALAFKAAVLHLKKEHLPVTGPTNEKTLYRLIASQARLHA